MSEDHAGFDAMSKYPLFEALHKRRSRRIGLGLQSVPAGSNTYTSTAKPQPLSELEEAVQRAAPATATDRTSPAKLHRREPGYAGSRASVPRSRSAP